MILTASIHHLYLEYIVIVLSILYIEYFKDFANSKCF